MPFIFNGNSANYLTRTTNLPTVTGFTAYGVVTLSGDTNARATFFALGNSSTGDRIVVGTKADGTNVSLMSVGGTTNETADFLNLAVNDMLFWAVTC